jgi:hypothetical protein
MGDQVIIVTEMFQWLKSPDNDARMYDLYESNAHFRTYLNIVLQDFFTEYAPSWEVWRVHADFMFAAALCQPAPPRKIYGLKEFRAHANIDEPLTATMKASLRSLHSFCSDLELIFFPSTTSRSGESDDRSPVTGDGTDGFRLRKGKC